MLQVQNVGACMSEMAQIWQSVFFKMTAKNHQRSSPSNYFAQTGGGKLRT